MIPSDSISSSATKIGVSVRTATATASEGRLETMVRSLAPAQMEFGEVGRGPQLGDEDLLDLDLEGAEHVLHEVMGQGPGHLHPLDGVGDGGRLGIADEDGQGPALPVGLLEQEDRRVGLQVHPYRTEKYSDHE